MESFSMHELLERLFGSMDAVSPPSLLDELQVLTNNNGIKLPDIYAEFLCKIETQSNLSTHAFGGFRFLRCAEVLAAWQSFYQLDGGEDEIGTDIAGDTDFRIRRVVFSRDRLPVAEFNGNIWIFLDFGPAAGGVVGQVIQVDIEALSWYWLSDSFGNLLTEIVDGRLLNPDMGTQGEDE